ncbi:hypothetical protein KOM00_11645 [Geomonas sp. Red69]|uniref:hypothetical protein n=1 Tax=Geomonas diazotrophica TaxID=2843197 RepID=UPI001C0F9C1E|nr:hypothetical protein [Geomonas diazotrophica]MBU5637384.1 hypothetical protein [Geomonas diazotrophica]
MLKYITLLSMCIFIAGCSPHTKDQQPVKNVELAELQENIRKNYREMKEVSILDLSGNNKYCLKRVEKYIKEQQLYYNNPNPMIVFYENFTLELNGTINTKGELKIAATPEGNVSISKGTEQKINWPVRVVSLSALPDHYLRIRLGLIQDYKDILEIEQRRKLVNEVMLGYIRLKKRVNKLQCDFHPRE